MIGAAAIVGACLRQPGPSRLSDAELYDRYCARCHGEDGRGDPRSVGLNPGLDLTRSELGQSRSSQQIYQRIAFGYGPMPGFARKLDAADIQRLTRYSIEFAENR